MNSQIQAVAICGGLGFAEQSVSVINTSNVYQFLKFDPSSIYCHLASLCNENIEHELIVKLNVDCRTMSYSSEC